MTRGTRAALALSLAAAPGLTSCSGSSAPAGTTRAPEPLVVEEFEQPAAWTAAPASGVELRLSADSGRTGGALRVDFDFRGQGGWAAFRRELPVTFPANYEITFWLRGDAPVNTLELKLVDASGDNVWWVNRPEFEFRGDWRRVRFLKRHVSFAWGPARGAELREAAVLEFAITAGTGGRGTIWLDDLRITPLEPVLPYTGTPTVSASVVGETAGVVADGDTLTAWRAPSGPQQLTVDFGRTREYGGAIVVWDGEARARDYDVQVSADGRSWETVRTVRAGGRARDYLQLPETESRYLRLSLLRAGSVDGYALRELIVQPLAWGESRNGLFETIAAASPRGRYPRYFEGVQSFWTVLGANGDDREALLNTEGMLEVDRGAFSIEPFLFTSGRLLTWADASLTQSLVDGYLPVPSVSWRTEPLRLEVTAWATPDSGRATLWARYRVSNASTAPVNATLFLALRPFQVNPPAQFLNIAGGATRMQQIRLVDGAVLVDSAQRVIPATPPGSFGAATFDQGDITSWLARGGVPDAAAVTDSAGLASAALAYPLVLAAGETRAVYVALPWHEGSPAPAPGQSAAAAVTASEAELQRTVAAWRGELDRFEIVLPGEAERIGRVVKSNLGYVLINRDAAAIQPGSRAYERSWIRDGSLTSAALLRLNHPEEVRSFIEWYAPYQYENGKVPCCVDRQGAGPVPEHDSHGQLIYLIAEYFRHTGDEALVREMWPHITLAVAHIDSLRQSRRTAEYRAPDRLAYFGLVPESISHEGYSEKPVHSYWDDAFILRGLKDAALLADTLGLPEATRFAALRDEFRADLLRSLALARRQHGIDYLPGSVELGDFDATSTTVFVTPGGELADLPESALRATFDRYWRNSAARWSGTAWDAYTPYELRTVGTFVRLGERARAQQLLDWFFQHQRPAAWNHWAEVVAGDSARPRFLGDMPHTWVGSDFIRSVLDMFAYEREADGALVLAAGVLPEWLADSVRVANLHTWYGPIGYTVARRGDVIRFRFAAPVSPGVPPGGYVIPALLTESVAEAVADGRVVARNVAEVRLARLPRELVLRYQRDAP